MDLHQSVVMDQVMSHYESYSMTHTHHLVRMFDLRHLEHSTIIYEARRPLLRLAWNGMDPNYIATLAMDVTEVIILDVRVPCTPVAKLSNHGAAGTTRLYQT